MWTEEQEAAVDTTFVQARQRTMEDEECRLQSFGDRTSPLGDNKTLAKMGFFWTEEEEGTVMKCCECHLTIDDKREEEDTLLCVANWHRETSPKCNYAKTAAAPRSKTFVSYDSLRYEKYRLETFIDWPLDWLKPSELARDGFYFMRNDDHCACVFCRGIVGAWEVGDTPRGEHRRHFPHCPYVRGRPVGNVPLAQGIIIERLHHGDRKESDDGGSSGGGGVLAVSGCRRFSEPKRKDYVTYDSRLASYVKEFKWPKTLCQSPRELAEAGFFYCGLSDHVRCFHCGLGFHNWERDDQPWTEHALHSPSCLFVNLTKGREFIREVQQKFGASTTTTAAATEPSYNSQRIVTEKALEDLSKLDVVQAVLEIGFPEDKVKAALRRHLERDGVPFFHLETCIEAVLVYMEDEERGTLKEESICPPTRGAEEERVLSQLVETNVIKKKERVQEKEEEEEATTTSRGASDGQPPKPTTSRREGDDKLTCKICMDDDIGVLFLPCNHMLACTSCALQISVCPMCRSEVIFYTKPIIS